MLRKIAALVACGALALTLAACGGTGEQLPALALEESSASSSTESGAPAKGEEAAPEEVPYTEFDNSLDGLCQFLAANKAVAGDPTEMAYETIGATGGYRYRFTLGGATVQVEVYQFDLDSLNDRATACLDSVKSTGSFAMLDNQVPATLSGGGQYMMIYTDPSGEEQNVQQKDRVLELFSGFYAE